MRKIHKFCYIILITSLLSIVSFQDVSALELSGAVGETVYGDINHIIGSGVPRFYTNNTAFGTSVSFIFNNPTLKVVVVIGENTIGTHQIPILVELANADENGTYQTSTTQLESLFLTITETSQKINKVNLPNGGIVKEGERLTSNAGFSFTPTQIGTNSVIINTENCDQSGVQLNYGSNETFQCSANMCTATIKPVFRFEDSSGTQFTKMDFFTNCFTQPITTNITQKKTCSINIQPTGTATRGQNLLISTKTENGEPIAANVLVTDSSIYTEDVALITNSPWNGLGKIYIEEYAVSPLTILARNEELDCEGTYVITELEGQLILTPEELEINKEKILVIEDLPTEEFVEAYISGILKDNEGNVLEDLNSVITIIDPDGEELISGTSLDGKFKFLASKVGEYIIKSSLDGYSDSSTHYLNMREPLKPITIALFRGDQLIRSGELVAGENVDVLLYEGDCKSFGNKCDIINDSISASVYINDKTIPLNIKNGIGSFYVNESGTHTIHIPESYRYLSNEMSIEATEAADYTIIVIVVIFVLIISVLFVLFKRKRGSKKMDEPKMGWSPGASDTPLVETDYELEET